MPHNHDWQSRIKAVEREYMAMQQAAAYFRQVALNDPAVIRDNLRHRDIVLATKNLEGTYVIRLFAEFETAVRQYWSANWATEPNAESLLNGLAARCGIPDAQLVNAHMVRDYRNALVHEREELPDVVPIETARGHLCRFFSFLPHRW